MIAAVTDHLPFTYLTMAVMAVCSKKAWSLSTWDLDRLMGNSPPAEMH